MIPEVYSTKKKEEDIEIDFDFEKANYIKWYDQALLNRPAKVIAAVILTAVVAPLLIYRFLFFESIDQPPSDGFSTGSCLISQHMRLPCGIEHMNESECHPQCCFDRGNNVCFHRLPSRFTYILRKWQEDEILQPRVSSTPYAFQSSKTNLKLSIDEQSSTHLTLTFYDSRDISLTGKRNENNTYTYEVSAPELNVIVNSTQGTVFNTARGPLIASNNIWEIAFQLTKESMYGLGELPLKLGTTKVLYNHERGLNSIPLIYAKINDSYHGVLIDDSSPIEVSVRGNNIVVRSITNAGLKIHVFMGPRPEDVMKDAMTVIGSKIKLEYWMLGAHMCSETAETLSDGLENLRNFISNATYEMLSYESHCGTGPIIFNADQCDVEDTEYIQRGIELLKEVGKRFIPHVSPHIIYNRIPTVVEEADNDTVDKCYQLITDYEKLFYRIPESFEIYQGLIGESKVLYPSYDYASIDFMKALWVYNGTLDGIVLENSWPLDQSNKTHKDTSRHLPYFSRHFAEAFDATPPWNLNLINNGSIYMQNHNRYGNKFANAFGKIFEPDIPTWSSSPWMKRDLAVNRQNIDASWTNLHRELVDAALGGISGHWLWSSPVCGDTEIFDLDRQASLCVKWYMASTFFPMLKIHSKVNPRDPLAFIGTHKQLIVEALQRRLSFLPYLYTTLQKGPILRPMFYQFPSSHDLADINSQFSVGDDLVIVPNLQPFQSHVHFWMPPGTWYELWSGLRLEGEEGQAITMTTTEADFLTVIRGGSILVIQKDTRTTAEETRLHSALSLTIALECMNNGTQCQATSRLFIEDDMWLVFDATENELVISNSGVDADLLCDADKAILTNSVNEIKIFGLTQELNNYDHHKHLQTSIDLCDLNNNKVFSLT